MIGKKGKFTSTTDVAWGKTYGGKDCVVVGGETFSDGWGELLIRFEDGVELTVGLDEFSVSSN